MTQEQERDVKDSYEVGLTEQIGDRERKRE